MPAFFGKNGDLVILDSTRGRDLTITGPKKVHVSKEVSAVHADISVDMLNPAAGTTAILAISTDRVYVGQNFRFSSIQIDLASVASADGGLLVLEYWNGAWTPIVDFFDGTAIGGHTMRQDGSVIFDIPAGWVKNDAPAAGTTLFYVRIRTTNSVATDPVAELIEPASGQYFTVWFADVNLNAPEGHARPEEMIRSNRGRLDPDLHYIQGPDDAIMQPVPLSFSAKLDSSVNRTALLEALIGGAPALTDAWPNATISTKTDTFLRSGLTGDLVRTPPFTDPTKKTVCLQGIWKDLAGARIGREYNEVFIDPRNITLQEAMDGVTLSVEGSVYGDIRGDLLRFGYRY